MIDVNVGENVYNIHLVSKKDKNLGEDCRGKIYYEDLDVYLDKDLPKTRIVQTFYHEMAHAMCDETSFNNMLMDKLGDNGYEIFIDNLGKAIYSLIHTNNLDMIEQSLSIKENTKRG